MDSRKVAFITGVTGQDGSYLAEYLLNKGYEVHGLKRRSSSFNTSRIDHIYQDPHLESRNFFLHYGDITDSSNLHKLVRDINPNEIYNLAAQSHVQVSFETPEYTANSDAIGPLRILEAVRLLERDRNVKFYQASSSEMFGLSRALALNEESNFHPRSPYAIAKLYAYWLTRNYREAYGIFASNGILFNHESPRRGETFVTKKVVTSAVNISKGLQEKLYLGNLNAVRDWGHAKDYVEGMWLILQHDTSDDWVLATGQAISVREFTEKVFSKVGIQIEWSGDGIHEKGVDQKGRILIEIDTRYFRPTDVPHLLGDATKARTELGWVPRITLDDLINEMVSSEVDK